MDNIANLLTILRNGQASKKETLKAPYSKVNLGVAEVLKKNGWIEAAEVKKKGEKSWLIISPKYNNEDKSGVINGLDRISKPGKRVYMGYSDIPVVNQGYGTVIISTPKGILTGKEAKKQKIGGEALCKVY